MQGPLWIRTRLNGRHVIVTLGLLYVALGLFFPLGRTGRGTQFEIAVIVSALTTIPGSVLVYGGYRLSESNIHTTLYNRIVGWCLAGVGLISAILAINAMFNGLTNLVHNALILTALSSSAGFGIGVYDAKARTRAREAEQRSHELAYQNNRLEHVARMLAHELRNPLAIATGYHQLSQPRNEDAAEKVQHAHERIEEMIDIILLNVRESKVSVSNKSTAIAEVASQEWEELPISTAFATLEVDTKQMIRGDPIHIHHLLSNLFQNSIKYSEDGVTVRIGELEDGFYVEDDGPGISTDTHNDVVEAGVSTRQHGMGLGLTVAIQIANLYDWSWKICDSESTGTRLEFSNVEFIST